MSIALLEMLSSAIYLSNFNSTLMFWNANQSTFHAHNMSCIYTYNIKRYSIYIYQIIYIYIILWFTESHSKSQRQQQQQQQVLCALQRAPQKKKSCVTIGPLNSSLNPKMLLPLSLGDSHTASTVSQWFHTNGIKALATCAKWCLI